MERKVQLANLFPLIMPPSWVSHQWGGPVAPIANGALHMTWAVHTAENRQFYVTDEQAAEWESDGIDWRAISLDNAAGLDAGEKGKWDESGHAFIRVLLNDDGLGPARLFIPHLFDDELGYDYFVAVPEMTCAVAFRKTLTVKQESDVAGFISGCFAVGTTPISDRRFSAKDFWVG